MWLTPFLFWRGTATCHIGSAAVYSPLSVDDLFQCALNADCWYYEAY